MKKERIGRAFFKTIKKNRRLLVGKDSPYIRNKRAFEGKEGGFDRFKDCWFQILAFLIKGHPLYSFENFKNLFLKKKKKEFQKSY